jgi:hypothetical protein
MKMSLKHGRILGKSRQAQITLEFLFSMIIVFIMMFSVFMIFRWAGYDFGWRRVDHDKELTKTVKEDYSAACLQGQTIPGPVPIFICTQWALPTEGPIEQIDPYFHKPAKMNAAWGL